MKPAGVLVQIALLASGLLVLEPATSSALAPHEGPGTIGVPLSPLSSSPTAAASAPPSPVASAAPFVPAGDAGAAAPAFAAGNAANDSDGDEGDHPTPSAQPAPLAPAAKPPPFVRQPSVAKDGMLRIPGGRFTMGTSDKNAPPNERSARTVTVAAFWIDRTEVTVAAYRTCVDRGSCARPPRTSPTCTFDANDPELPISCVPWSAANAYCLAIGKRLPREIEWEYAARGTTPIRYPWGATVGCGVAAVLAGETTNRSCSGKRPSKVGAHGGGASPYGVQDMSGNVEEWVADWYAESVSDFSPLSGASHVLRGGGWLTIPSLARTTTRNWGSVQESGPNVGFRCAKDEV